MNPADGPRAAWVACAAMLILISAAAAQTQRSYSGSCTDAGCHGGYLKKASIHQPVENSLCDACHVQVTGQPHRFRFTLPAEELCSECHAAITEDREFLHGPVAAGGCTACHDPHAAEHDALLSKPVTEICIDCHTAVGELMESDGHLHQPATEGCVACHDPHGSSSKVFLTSRQPALCVDCHEDIAEILEDAAVGHDAMLTGKSCSACHNPHASTREHLLIGESMDLCLSCHNRELDSDDGKIRNVGQWLADHTNHHGPIRNRDCVACHEPHGGEHYRLLVDQYPVRFYADFHEKVYALCFECHDIEMMLEAETDELTDFRNGKQNLHAVHVNRPVKGRTCRSCHEPHAAAGPKLIADSVKFGQWDLPIRFQMTDTGGSCAPGCHRPYQYDRESAVENLPKSKSE